MSPLERFRTLLQIPTMSSLDESTIDWDRFDEFVAALPTLYPALHAVLGREIVAGHSLLYRWPGTISGRASTAPVVLMAHYDVVPATAEKWEHPPFAAELSGEGENQLIWGRGTLDDKGALVAILEAVEASVLAGHTPTTDIYLFFGHNEETTGAGASAAVALLESRGIRPSLVVDEGGAVVEGIFPGVDDPIAVVGVSEKGILSVTLTVEQEGGHASTPPKRSATVRLAGAITRLDARPFRSSFGPTNLEMIRTIGARARQPYRWVFTNLWLTRRPLLALFARLGDETNAIIRTTGVVTRLAGSAADNVLAERATATVNVRVAVGSSVAEAVQHIRRAVGDDGVRIDVLNPTEPSPVSPTTGPVWELLRGCVAEAFPGAIVTPYIQLGASDSRHFTRISDSVYRFTPFEMSKDERGTLHAINERIHVATWLRGIRFYESLVSRL